MKRILIVSFLFLAVAGCSGKSKGWSQGERDKLISSCVEEVKKTPGVEESKVNGYCSCYQQVLEKKYAKLTDMATVGEEALSKLAEECLPLMAK